MKPKTKAENIQNSAKTAKTIIFQAVLLAVLTFIVFSGTIRNGFVWDDDDYIHKNQLLTDPHGLAKIWKSYYAPSYNPEQNTPQYYPFVFTSFFLEHKLWGFNPAGYHVINLLLHIANVILLLIVLNKLGFKWYISFITAAIFAIHPTQVESVAWATERKNVLTGLFYFAAFLSFLRFEDSSKIKFYLLSIGLFICALLSKTASVMLPVVLILAAYLRGRPIKKTIIYSIPFFIISLAAGLVTWLVEHTLVGTKGAEWDFGLLQRFEIATHSFWFYIGKILWPHPISFLYGQWKVNPYSLEGMMPLIGAIVLLAAVLILHKKTGKLPFFCFGYFGFVAAPALGFISFYMMRYTFMADHFIYLGSWSIMLLIVTGSAWIINHIKSEAPKIFTAIAVTIIALGFCAGLSAEQVKKYKNVQSLWEHTISVSPDAWLAHNNLGVIYAGQGQPQRAIEHYLTTIKLNPKYHLAYNNLGVSYAMTNQSEKAIENYKKALELKPDYTESYYNLAAVYSQMEKNNEAAENFKIVVKDRPKYFSAWYNLAICFSKMNKLSEAAEAYKKAAEISPTHPEVHYNLAVTYQLMNKLDDAVIYFQKALELKPAYIEAKYRLAQVFRQQNKFPEAIKYLQSALEQEPDFAQADFDLGMIYYSQGQFENAKFYFRVASNYGLETPPEIRQVLSNK